MEKFPLLRINPQQDDAESYLDLLDLHKATQVNDMVDTPKPSIGNAYMNAKGVITLYLRAESGGTIGDGVLTYEPQDKEYDSIIKHLNGIKPGEYRPVPPFDNNDQHQK